MKIVSKVRAKYKHFTETERYKLEGMVAGGVPLGQIGQMLKKNRVTVYREIKRGKVKLKNSELIEVEKYRADVAQADYDKKVSNRERSLKIGNDQRLEEYIRKKIKKEASLIKSVGNRRLRQMPKRMI
jgi:IS30 family transposase